MTKKELKIIRDELDRIKENEFECDKAYDRYMCHYWEDKRCYLEYLMRILDIKEDLK